MKKLRKLLISFTILSSFSITSCNLTSEIDNYIGSEYLQYNLSVNNLVKLSSDQFISKVTLLNTTPSISNNFLVLIYSLSCSTCKKVESYISSLASNEHFVIYAIEISDYKLVYDQYKDDSNFNNCFYNITSYPTFLYYKSENNSISCKLQPLGNEFYKDEQTFSICLHKFFSSSKIYYLNDVSYSTIGSFTFDLINYDSYSYLSYKIKNSSNIAIFYTWDKCADCTSLFSNFLYEYSKSNSNIYCFESSYYRELKYSQPSVYDDFVSLFEFKNQDGYIPTLVKYSNGKMVESCKYDTSSNDSINQSIDKIKSIYSSIK